MNGGGQESTEGSARVAMWCRWKIQVGPSFTCRRGESACRHTPAITICLFIKQNQSDENEQQLGVESA